MIAEIMACVARPANGRAVSKARLARRTRAAAPSAPTICRPIGNPARVIPQGTDAAGCCVRLNG
jgi:hypothetical protein